MRELLYSFKSTWLYLAIKALLVSSCMVVCYYACSFVVGSGGISDEVQSVDGSTLYQIADGMYEPERYEQFRQSAEEWDKISSFYSALIHDERTRFLSIQANSVGVSSFSPESQFLEHTELTRLILAHMNCLQEKRCDALNPYR